MTRQLRRFLRAWVDLLRCCSENPEECGMVLEPLWQFTNEEGLFRVGPLPGVPFPFPFPILLDLVGVEDFNRFIEAIETILHDLPVEEEAEQYVEGARAFERMNQHLVGVSEQVGMMHNMLANVQDSAARLEQQAFRIILTGGDAAGGNVVGEMSEDGEFALTVSHRGDHPRWRIPGFEPVDAESTEDPLPLTIAELRQVSKRLDIKLSRTDSKGKIIGRIKNSLQEKEESE